MVMVLLIIPWVMGWAMDLPITGMAMAIQARSLLMSLRIALMADGV